MATNILNARILVPLYSTMALIFLEIWQIIDNELHQSIK